MPVPPRPYRAGRRCGSSSEARSWCTSSWDLWFRGGAPRAGGWGPGQPGNGEAGADFLLQRTAMLHQPSDEVRRGRGSRVVSRAPADDLQEDGQQIRPLGGELVAARLAARDDPICFEPGQPVREDVGGDSFLGSEELAVGTAAFEHQIPHNQQGPGVAEHLEGEVDRAIGPAPLPSHAGTLRSQAVNLRSASRGWRGVLAKCKWVRRFELPGLWRRLSPKH